MWLCQNHCYLGKAALSKKNKTKQKHHIAEYHLLLLRLRLKLLLDKLNWPHKTPISGPTIKRLTADGFNWLTKVTWPVSRSSGAIDNTQLTLTCTLTVTTAQVVKTSVTLNNSYYTYLHGTRIQTCSKLIWWEFFTITERFLAFLLLESCSESEHLWNIVRNVMIAKNFSVYIRPVYLKKYY